MTAENCTMQQAKAYGMVQRIVNDASEFPAVVQDIASKITACAPGAVSAAKRCTLSCLNQPISAGLIDYTVGEYVKIRQSEECEEGMKALDSRTRPSWVTRAINVKTS